MSPCIPIRIPALSIMACAIAFAGLPQKTLAGRWLGVGVAQPKNYVSPSGVYALFVDPANRRGRGGARYRLSKNGDEVWSGEKPYTLREVEVTDEGLAAGFAYRTGPKQEEPEGQPHFLEGAQNPPEYLHIIILGAGGSEILNNATERVHPPYLSNPPSPLYPYIEQLVIDPANDRVIARVVARGARWWVYRLSTGESLARFKPTERMEKMENLRYVLDARPVAGTPLLLVHWYLKGPDYKVKDDGGRFTLFDAEFNPVWSFNATNDYAELDLHEHVLMGRGPSDYFEDHPAILRTDEPRRFDIRLFAENKEVAYSVRPTGEGSYEVTELGRIDVPKEEDAEPLAGEPQMTPLAYLGELELGTSDAEESPFRGLWDFTFDSESFIHFVKRTKDQITVLYTTDAAGGVVREHDIPSGKMHWTEIRHFKDGRFFVSGSVKREEDHTYEVRGWWVNFVSGEVVRAELELDGRVSGVARFDDGALVVLDDRLTCYDTGGAILWRREQYREGQLSLSMGGAGDVVVTRDQRVAFLGYSTVTMFDKDGSILRTVDLVGAFGNDEFGGRPGYLHEVVADNDGGFLIADSSNPPVVLRYNADGSLRSRWSPRHPDGKTFDLRGGIRVAPDGRLWTSDGNSIMRLTDEGVVDLVLGPQPQADRLDRIAAFTVDQQGNLYAVAHGSGVVHVFDRQGMRTRIIEPDPTDVAGTVSESFIAVKDDGEVYVKKPRTKAYMPPDEYLRFSPTGERLETITFEPSISVGRFLSPGWAFQPKTGYRCGICQMRGDTRLVIVEPPDKLVREVRKRPNGKWLGDRTNLAMAPNGSMAILDRDIFDEKRVYEVDLFSAKGDPIRTIRLPPPREHYSGIAYDGRRVVVAGQREVAVLDTADDGIERWSLIEPGITRGQWSAFIMPDSDELLLSDERGRKLHRYALPSVDTTASQEPTAEEADAKQPPDPSEATVHSDWVKKYLEVLAALPKPGPCVAYVQKTDDGERALTEAQAMELPEEERSAMRTMNLDNCGIRFDAPRVYARLLDILAAAGIESIEGLKVLDFGCCDIRHLQALARLGVDALDVQAGYSLTAMCNDLEDMGKLTGPDGQVGHLEVIPTYTLHPKGGGRDLGKGYDFITFRNLLQATSETDYFSPEQWTQTSIASTKEEFVQRVYDALAPGGYVLSYSVGIAPFLAESSIDRSLWESAGFDVVAFDCDDRGAALGIGIELGWDKQVVAVEENVRAMYMLAQRPSEP